MFNNKKSVLGKGLSALIPTAASQAQPAPPEKKPEQVPVPEKTPEPVPSVTAITVAEKEPEKTASFHDSQEIEHKPEKKLFFNAKTGRYEEMDHSSGRYDTKEITVLSGRRTGTSLPPAPASPLTHRERKPVERPATTTPRPAYRPEASRSSIQLPDHEIKEFIRREIESHQRSYTSLIQGEIDRMRYLEKKITETKVTPQIDLRQVTKMVEELRSRMDNLQQEVKTRQESLQKEITARFDTVQQSMNSRLENVIHETRTEITHIKQDMAQNHDIEEQFSELSAKAKTLLMMEDMQRENSELKRQLQDLMKRVALRERQMLEQKKEIDNLKEILHAMQPPSDM